MELESSELLKRLIQAGVGIGFLPESNVRVDVDSGALKRAGDAGASGTGAGLSHEQDSDPSRTAFPEVATEGTPHSAAVVMRRKA